MQVAPCSPLFAGFNLSTCSQVCGLRKSKRPIKSVVHHVLVRATQQRGILSDVQSQLIVHSCDHLLESVNNDITNVAPRKFLLHSELGRVLYRCGVFVCLAPSALYQFQIGVSGVKLREATENHWGTSTYDETGSISASA